MTRIIAIANQKGGVGKTTTAINLAAFLQNASRRTLLMDFDPQANATSGIGAELPERSPLSKIAADPDTLPSLLEDTYAPNLRLLPSRPDFEPLRSDELVQDRIQRFRANLQDSSLGLDYVIIDCPPALGPVSLLALQLADSVLIPVQAEYYPMEGLSQMVPLIEGMKTQGRALQIEGLLLTMFSADLQLSHDVLAEVHKFFPEKTFQTVIPRDVALAESTSHAKPIWEYDIRSSGSWAYLNLTREVLSNEP